MNPTPVEALTVRPQEGTSPPSNVAADDDLTGTTWLLDQFGSPKGLTLALGEQIPTISFQKNGLVSGSTGCNQFKGDYELNDSQIRFNAIAVTKKMCSGLSGLLEQEQTILKTMETGGRFQIEGGKLSVFSSGDAQILIYKK